MTTTIRIQIECNGVVTSDETCDDFPTTWRAIGDMLSFGGYAYKLKDFTMVDGWLTYTAHDGTVIRARRLYA